MNNRKVLSLLVAAGLLGSIYGNQPPTIDNLLKGEAINHLIMLKLEIEDPTTTGERIHSIYSQLLIIRNLIAPLQDRPGRPEAPATPARPEAPATPARPPAA